MKWPELLAELRYAGYREFLRWWAGELAFLVPEPWRLWYRRRHNRVLLRVGDTGLEAYLGSAAGSRLLGCWERDEETGQPAAAIAAEREAEGAETVLLLDAAEVLRRSIVLPLAARENLHQVVSFELDRYTPFNSSQLYYDARLGEPLADGLRVRVDFAAVPQAVLDGRLAQLAAAGIAPGRVDVALSGQRWNAAGFDLLPEPLRPRRSGLALRLTQALAVLLCLLLTGVGALPAMMDDAFIEQLQEEVRRATKAAKAVEAMREETEQLGKAAAFVLDKKLSQAPLIALLEDLTERLPDDGWLTSMQIREKHIEMQGQAQTASALIALLEDSPYLHNTTFLAPVTPDPNSRMERFRIGADIVAGPGASAALAPAGAAAPSAEDDGDSDDDAQ
jgi:general secretion pathway protein L